MSLRLRGRYTRRSLPLLLGTQNSAEWRRNVVNSSRHGNPVETAAAAAAAATAAAAWPNTRPLCPTIVSVVAARRRHIPPTALHRSASSTQPLHARWVCTSPINGSGERPSHACILPCTRLCSPTLEGSVSGCVGGEVQKSRSLASPPPCGSPKGEAGGQHMATYSSKQKHRYKMSVGLLPLRYEANAANAERDRKSVRRKRSFAPPLWGAESQGQSNRQFKMGSKIQVRIHYATTLERSTWFRSSLPYLCLGLRRGPLWYGPIY
eukprot:351893-Chlamydomonas_euryale.AAC.10